MISHKPADYQWNFKACTGPEFAIHQLMLEVLNTQVPDLVELFEMKGPFKSRTYSDSSFLVVEVSRNLGAQFPTCALLSGQEVQQILESLSESEITFDVVSKHFEVTFLKGIFISRLLDGRASWQCIYRQVIGWLNMHVLPRIETLNSTRVTRALPTAKSFNPLSIFEHLVILEDEQDMKQGSAFRIDDGTFVTCAHSLGRNSKAIFPNSPNVKFDLTIICKEDDIDLARFSIDAIEIKRGLPIGTADSLVQLSQICVVGFPNYNCGDSGVLVPGNITGFRMKSGIRRMLTNAIIIAGTSGGPVLNSESKVIGVAVTGSDFQETADQTEKHGIIPIDALKYLKK